MKGPSTVRQVHEVLASGHAPGYTTVLKLLQIMTDKGLATREQLEYSRKVWLDTQEAFLNGGRVVSRLTKTSADEYACNSSR